MVNISEVEKESGSFNQAIRVGGFSSTAASPKPGFGARPTGKCIFERRSTLKLRSKSPGLGLAAAR